MDFFLLIWILAKFIVIQWIWCYFDHSVKDKINISKMKIYHNLMVVSDFFGFVDLILPTPMPSREKLLFSLFPDTLILAIFWNLLNHVFLEYSRFIILITSWVIFFFFVGGVVFYTIVYPVLSSSYILITLMVLAVSALNVMYSSMNSPSQLDGWKSSGGDPCDGSWKGIKCSGSSVTEMYILYHSILLILLFATWLCISCILKINDISEN